MLPINFLLTLLATVTAAPHAHNQRQNSVRRRSTPLLHNDVLALYNAGVSATSTTSAAASSSTTAAVLGPYAAGELHGGNPNALKAVVDVDTATTATAAATASTETSISANGWVVAAAPRNTTMNSSAYTSDSDTEDDANAEDDDDSSDDDFPDDQASTSAAALSSSSTPAKSTGGQIQPWAIALAVLLSVSFISGTCCFLYLRYKKSRGADKEKTTVKKESDDALSSYKAFWELKRQSAGSFTSADATPAALAIERGTIGLGLRPLSMNSDTTLPMYQERDGKSAPSSPSSAAATPVNEEAPPRGFLYQ